MKLNKITKAGYYQDTANEKILFHVFPDDSKRAQDTSNENKLVVEQLECIDVDDNDRRIYEIADDTFLYVKNVEPIDVEETDIKLIDYLVYDYIEDKPTYKNKAQKASLEINLLIKSLEKENDNSKVINTLKNINKILVGEDDKTKIL